MSFFKRRWQLHQLKKDYAECDKRFIKKKYKECKYDAVKCRVALNNAAMEDGAPTMHNGSRQATNRFATDALPPRNMQDHNIYEEPVNQETSDPGTLFKLSLNSKPHILKNRFKLICAKLELMIYTVGVVWRAHESRNYQVRDVTVLLDITNHLSSQPCTVSSGKHTYRTDALSVAGGTFDESEISPMVQRSPKLGHDPTGEYTTTSDLPEHLLILTPRVCPLLHLSLSLMKILIMLADQLGFCCITVPGGEYLQLVEVFKMRLIAYHTQNHGISGVEFRACESRDYKGDEGALNAPKSPNLYSKLVIQNPYVNQII
uniref:Uncharacterized protein n=1 Tax=Echinococcus canadensis TaxID=519352 RepID=A0A915ET96_9CEST